MKRKLASILLVAVMMLSLAACGTNEATDESTNETQTNTETTETTETTDTTDTTEDEEIEIGKVIIGIDGAYPPYNYMDDNNEIVGFEIAMIDEIAKRTGLEVEYQALPWDGIFGQMDAGKIDTVVCCIFPNEERQEKYLFSSEYIYDENRFMVREGDGSKYKTYDDLVGKKIGVSGGGNTIMVLEELQKEYDFEIVAYSQMTFVNDLALGRLDLIYQSPVSALEQAKSIDAAIEMAECPAVEQASCAIPWRKDDARSAAICELFSEATKEMIEDGTMKALCEEWLGMDLSVYDPLYDF